MRHEQEPNESSTNLAEEVRSMLLALRSNDVKVIDQITLDKQPHKQLLIEFDLLISPRLGKINNYVTKVPVTELITMIVGRFRIFGFSYYTERAFLGAKMKVVYDTDGIYEEITYPNTAKRYNPFNDQMNTLLDMATFIPQSAFNHNEIKDIVHLLFDGTTDDDRQNLMLPTNFRASATMTNDLNLYYKIEAKDHSPDQFRHWKPIVYEDSRVIAARIPTPEVLVNLMLLTSNTIGFEF